VSSGKGVGQFRTDARAIEPGVSAGWARDEPGLDNRVVVVLTAAVLTMSAAQLLDLATFAEMVRRVGPEAETNPLVGWLFELYGLPMVAMAKLLLIAGVTGVVVLLDRWPARPRLVGAVLLVGILVGLIGGFSNAVAMGAL
jgi:hypothetical protein